VEPARQPRSTATLPIPAHPRCLRRCHPLSDGSEPAQRVKRARTKSGCEGSGASGSEDVAAAAWSRTTHKSREVLVREYIMMLVLERRNLRFKEYLCAAPSPGIQLPLR
jgi:hypothetical protein